MNGYLILASSYMVVGFFGMIITGFLTGVRWPILAMIVFFPIFLSSLKYTFYEDSRILHCLANHGIPKLWKYRPGPLNAIEKITFLAGALFFGIFPFTTQIFGIWFLYNSFDAYDFITRLGLIGIAVATILSAIAFFAILLIHYCTHCINFSCPLNQVPKTLVDDT